MELNVLPDMGTCCLACPAKAPSKAIIGVLGKSGLRNRGRAQPTFRLPGPFSAQSLIDSY